MVKNQDLDTELRHLLAVWPMGFLTSLSLHAFIYKQGLNKTWKCLQDGVPINENLSIEMASWENPGYLALLRELDMCVMFAGTSYLYKKSFVCFIIKMIKNDLQGWRGLPSGRLCRDFRRTLCLVLLEILCFFLYIFTEFLLKNKGKNGRRAMAHE